MEAGTVCACAREGSRVLNDRQENAGRETEFAPTGVVQTPRIHSRLTEYLGGLP
jgi:hypothetical protein